MISQPRGKEKCGVCVRIDCTFQDRRGNNRLCGWQEKIDESMYLLTHPVPHLLPQSVRNNHIRLHQFRHLVVLLLNGIIVSIDISGPRFDLSLPHELRGISCHNGIRFDILRLKSAGILTSRKRD